MSTFTAATTAMSRVFVAEGLPGPRNAPQFKGCLVMGGASQSMGDTEYIYCPDPAAYNSHIVVGDIVGREEGVETSLSGHFPLGSLSDIVKWGKSKTPLAIHCHFGQVSNPQNFNTFLKALIFDNRARLTSTEIDEMGALDESTAIGQSADVSAAGYYEVVPLQYITQQNALIDEPVAGVEVTHVYNDHLNINNRFAYYVALKGTPSTGKGSIVFSIDGGLNWSQLVADTMTAGNFLSDLAVINDVPVAVSEDESALYYADVLNGALSVSEVAAGAAITCIGSSGSIGYVGGPSGYFGKLASFSATPEQMTIGTSAAIVSVAARGDSVILAGTSNGFVFYSVDGVNFGSFELDTGVAITAVGAASDVIFWAGTAGGDLYFSDDSGNTWEMRNFPGSGASGSTVTDITFPTLSVGYIAFEPASGDAQIIKTVGAGAVGTWYTVPTSGALPAGSMLSLSTPDDEPNVLLAGGIDGDDSADGVAILGIGV